MHLVVNNILVCACNLKRDYCWIPDKKAVDPGLLACGNHLGLLQAWVPFAFARLGGVGVGLRRVLKKNHDTEFEGELCVLFGGPKVAVILLGCK